MDPRREVYLEQALRMLIKETLERMSTQARS